jgi:ArsR family transcriptional regulator
MTDTERDELCAEEVQHEGVSPQDLGRLLADPSTAGQLAQVFRAMADPTRVRIISALACAEMCVGDIAAALEMSVSAVSHQLRLLRDLRVVRKRRDGKHIYYALDDEHIQELFALGLEHVRHT